MNRPGWRGWERFLRGDVQWEGERVDLGMERKIGGGEGDRRVGG